MSNVTGGGYIKLYRKLIGSRVFQNEGLLKVWIYCLIKANHETAWVPVTTGKGTTEVEIKAGQFIFGRKAAAKELKMSPATIYDRMKKLEKMQNIGTQSGTHYSIISITNWETYQEDQKKSGTQSGTQATPNQHPTGTNKNDKNEKNKELSASGDAEGEILVTKKNRKLTGKRLETFLSFWDAFQDKRGKASAADSWLDIPLLTNALVERIVSAATAYAKERPALKARGGTPKMAQGWLTDRRWEDEIETPTVHPAVYDKPLSIDEIRRLQE